MKVYNLKTRTIEEYNDSYAARLIEQGVAILPDKPAKQPKPIQEAGAEGSTKGKAVKAGGK